MRTILVGMLAISLSGCAAMRLGEPTVSILVDLDPASVERTVIVESITADRNGVLYLADRVTGNILRVDPKSPKAVVVGRIEAREIKGKIRQCRSCGYGVQPPRGPFRRRWAVQRSGAHRGCGAKPGEAGICASLRDRDGWRQWHRL